MGLLRRISRTMQKPKTLADDNPELSARLEAQDQQLAAVHQAEEAFANTGDIGSLIEFWEDIWANGGLLFNGSRWTFRLPDLYIKIEDYDNALRILGQIKNPEYQEKVYSYIERVTKLKLKQKKA